MRLVAGALEQAQRGAAARQPQWIAVARQIDLFFSFGETHDRQPLLSLLLRRFDRRGQLSLPAVDHDQIGNLFLLGDTPRQEPRDDLFHGREETDSRSGRDRRREGTAGRGGPSGEATRTGAVADRESRQTRRRGLSAGLQRSTAAVAPQPLAAPAPPRPRRGASLCGQVHPQTPVKADNHVGAAAHSRCRAGTASRVARAVRVAGGCAAGHAGGNRRAAGLLDEARRSHPRPPASKRMPAWPLECSACEPVRTRGAEGLPGVCEVCGSPYLVRYESLPSPEAKSLLRRQRWTMWRYDGWLPLTTNERPVTLGEGGTPLLTEI